MNCLLNVLLFVFVGLAKSAHLIDFSNGLHRYLGNVKREASCHPADFECNNRLCIKYRYFCDGKNHCGDNSDEQYCKVDPSFECPYNWNACPNRRRCIPSHWMCDGRLHCPDASEELWCYPERPWMFWLLQSRKSSSRLDRWGPEVHRTAVALHLVNQSTFSPGNSTGDEIRYELTIKLLHRLGRTTKISSQELALYIHALLVACIDPRDFYGYDLVWELRRRVQATRNYTNPFLILVLCNAGDDMTAKDLGRVVSDYMVHYRAFWTDSQALASMALSCISARDGVSVHDDIFRDMLNSLKGRQFKNGTVDNFKTTALVAQAFSINNSYVKDFDLDLAIKVLAEGPKTVQNAYYALPVFLRKSLLDVTSGHCSKEPVEENEIVQKLLDAHGNTVTLRFSVWMGDEINLVRTWRLKMCENSTIYEAIETVDKVVNKHRVEYNVVDGKPFVTAWNGKHDDPEMGTFWHVYRKTGGNTEIVDESPVDFTVSQNEEIILWYKRGPWSV